MQHYYHPESRAVTTSWMLAELGVDHESILIDFHAGANHQEEFVAINPMRKVPTLVDGGVVVTEAAAICAYLADKYIDQGLAPAVTSPLRGQYYRYLFFPGTTLEPLFTFNMLDTQTLSAQSAGFGDLERGLHSIEVMTPEQDWVLPGQFSAADVVYGGTIDFAVQFGWIASPSEKVRSYVQRLKSRPAYRATHDESWY